MTNLPEKFIERMRSRLGARFDDYLHALKFQPTKGLHLGVKAQSSVSSKLGGLSALAFGESCYAVKSGKPGAHPYHSAGLYYMQEPSAMLPAAAVDLPKNAKVLDLCSAPGGKSSVIASRLNGEGLLVSNEIERSRALILRENLVRMGYRNAVVMSERPARIAQIFGGYFDVVIVDAPCSGEGMFRKEPQAVLDWSEANVRACAVRQKEIVRSADACLKEGGTLVYSTCTFSEEEDEEVVDFIISLGYEILPAPEAIAKLGVDVGKGYKFYPHLFGEGQFFCLLRKTSLGASEVRLKKGCQTASSSESKLVESVVKAEGKIAKKEDMLFIPALDVDLPCLMNGVMLGKLEKGRFTPAHGLFTALGGECLQKIDLTLEDERVSAYLRGEEIAGEVKGWCAVLVDGYALGGGKGSGGVIKNHYPKSLRRLL